MGKLTNQGEKPLKTKKARSGLKLRHAILKSSILQVANDLGR